MPPPPPQRRFEYRIFEFGFLALLLGALTVVAPLVLRGSHGVNLALRSAQPAGWCALVLGLVLLIYYSLQLRRQAGASSLPSDDIVAEARSSRFQSSVLPEELLNPPSRIRLDPLSTLMSTQPASFERSTLPSLLDAADEPTLPLPRRADHWCAEVFEQIEWRRFEAVCAALFAQAGFEPRTEPGGAQRATLMWLHSRHAQGPVAVACCRHWLKRPLGVVDLEPLRAAMADHQLKRATCVTSGGYTRKALDYAQKHGINLLDGPALLALIGRRRPEQQTALLEVAYEGEYWRPTCASCGSKMVIKAGPSNGPGFWGCTAYPRCRHTLPLAT